MQCSKCLISDSHPFGVFFDANGICSGCNAFNNRRNALPPWNDSSSQSRLKHRFLENFQEVPDKAIVPFEPDGETWFVLETLTDLSIQPVVVYFNTQYADLKYFEMLSVCQENFDCDFLGFSIPQELIKWCIAEELACGLGHGRKLEIFGRYISCLFAAEKLDIHHIFSGPNQQSEIVGNHNYVVANQLKLPAILKFVTGGPLLPQVQQALNSNGSAFTTRFSAKFANYMLNKIHWHHLSDYIFWDSQNINDFFGKKFKVKPRDVNGYDECWQASSSALKLEYFDLIRIMMTGHSKIESYLSRDIRFGRIDKFGAQEALKRYLQKDWDLLGFSKFIGIDADDVLHGLDLMNKSKRLRYHPSNFKRRLSSYSISHHQVLFPRASKLQIKEV